MYAKVLLMGCMLVTGKGDKDDSTIMWVSNCVSSWVNSGRIQSRGESPRQEQNVWGGEGGGLGVLLPTGQVGWANSSQVEM